MDVVVNRLNNGQGAIGFHHGDIGFHVVSPASGIPEPRSLYPVVPKTYDRFGLATGPKSEKLTGPFGNEVATKCILGASRSSAFDAPLSPSVPAGPQRCSGWHAATRRALAVLAKFGGAALDRSRNDRAGICTAGR